MKICFISPYPPKKGGLSVYTKRTIDDLISRKNIKVSIIPHNNILDTFKISNIWKMAPDIVRIEYNLPAYGMASIFIFIIFLFFKCFTKIKFVVNYHEVKRETDMLGLLGKLYFYTFSTVFNHIYVHTNEAKKILVERCQVGSSKITVIPLGTFELSKNNSYRLLDTKTKYNYGNKLTVTYIGFIHTDKGIEHLIEAVDILQRSIPNFANKVQVVIAGDVRGRSGLFKIFEKKDIRYMNKLKNLVNTLRLGNTIKFLGYIDDEEMFNLLDLADMFVVPYLNVEQSGILNMILPFNKPIIASNIGGLKEVLSKTGILVEPGKSKLIANEIRKLILDKDYYSEVQNRYKQLSTSLKITKINNKFINSLKYI